MLSTRKNTGSCIFCTFRAISSPYPNFGRERRRLNDEKYHAAPAQTNAFATSAQLQRLPSGTRSSKRNDYAYSRNVRGSSSQRSRLPDRSLNVQRRSKPAPVDIIKLTLSRLDYLSSGKVDSPLLQSLQRDGNKHENSFVKFKTHTIAALKNYENRRYDSTHSASGESLYKKLQSIYNRGGTRDLDAHLKYEFYGYISKLKFSKPELQNHVELVDLRYPSEWYPKARTTQREIHLHVGPTNSGKTYHALKRLEQAEVGVYAGPLRLLAQEVYARMNNSGKRCLLVTGEERRSPDEELKAALISCTVEMMPVSSVMDVAVIDEIQMIGSPDRGWAWTQAFLGVNAKEVHLCGEERAVPLIRELTTFVGDRLHIHRYKRLSPLEVMWQSLDGNLKQLRKGDCIVSFSIMGIHSMKKDVEKATGRKVAIVYGSLPPETRAQQARLFNDPNNDYDFLVASDAVGMGLNLSIKRIVFESVLKFDGQEERMLTISEMKQIAGRAGRYRTADPVADDKLKRNATQPNDSGSSASGEPSDAETGPERRSTPPTTGLVTTMERDHLPFVRRAMSAAAEPIKTAGIFPPDTMVQRFSTYFPPNTPFSYILLRLHDIAQRSSRFHLCALRDQLFVADAIHPVQKLSVQERIKFSAAPAGNNPLLLKLLKKFASYVADQKECSIIDVLELPLEILDSEKPGDRGHLRQLENLHKGINLYLWLSYRFHGVFNSRMLAFYAKKLVEAAIERSLASYNFVRRRRNTNLLQDEEKINEMLRPNSLQAEGEDGEEADDGIEASSASNAGDSGSGLYETDDPLVDGEELEDVDEPSSTLPDNETGEEASRGHLAGAAETDLVPVNDNIADIGTGAANSSHSGSTPVLGNDEDEFELSFHEDFKASSPQWTKESEEPLDSNKGADDDKSHKGSSVEVDEGIDDFINGEVNLSDEPFDNGGSRHATDSKASVLRQHDPNKVLNAARGPVSIPVTQAAKVNALVSAPPDNKTESTVDGAH